MVATFLSTNDKLLRAREASARLAQLSTAQKNAILMVMAGALEANSESIIEANRTDVESSGLAAKFGCRWGSWVSFMNRAPT